MDLDALITVGQAALLTGRPKQTVHWWHTSGLLPAAAETKPGAPRRYRVRDVLDAERQTRRSGKSHRTGTRCAA